MEHQYAPLDASCVDQILALQDKCWEFDRGIFILSSRALIERSFQFRNFAFGAFAENELVGFVTCSVPGRRAKMNLGRHFGFSDEMLDKVGHANSMAILPEYRRKGIGGKLFNLAMAAFPDNVEYIMTTTKLENELARLLIESRGFRHESTEEIAGGMRAIYVLHRTEEIKARHRQSIAQ